MWPARHQRGICKLFLKMRLLEILSAGFYTAIYFCANNIPVLKEICICSKTSLPANAIWSLEFSYFARSFGIQFALCPRPCCNRSKLNPGSQGASSDTGNVNCSLSRGSLSGRGCSRRLSNGWADHTSCMRAARAIFKVKTKPLSSRRSKEKQKQARMHARRPPACLRR